MDSPFSYSRGELPAGWNKRRLGSLLQFRNGQDVPGTDNESKSYPVYGSGGEFKRTNKYLFDGTSILFGRKGTIDKPLLVNGRFWAVDTMYFTVPRPDVDPRFVYYWALDAPLSILSTNTAVPSMTSSDLAQLYLAVPPLDTQCAIADYLDRETAEIDDMRTDLDKMERLMTERRQAIKAKYFESSTSYTAVKVKYVATINTGSGDTQDAIEDGQYPFYVRSDTVLSSNQWEFNGPAVLTAGDGAGVGKIFHYAEGKFKVHQRVYCIHGFRDVDPMYFFHAFSYLLPKEVLYGGASSTVPSLRMHMLEDLQIPLPPLAEQRRIAGEINRETSEINLMLEDIKKLRNLLAERRAAVISAAVTGQIDIPASPTTKDESHA